MDRVPSDKAKDLPTPIWQEYENICHDAEGTKVIHVTICVDFYINFIECQTCFQIWDVFQSFLLYLICLKK